MRQGVRIGVDVGDVRIGVARSDPSGLIATPLETVASGRGDLARLLALASEEGAVEVVVGLPRSLSGGEGPAATKVRGFASRLADAVAPLPVRLCDERLSTVSAEAVLREQGRKGQKRRAVVDQAAAVVILQNALDTERGTGVPPGELVPGRSTTEGVRPTVSDLGLELEPERRERPRRAFGCLAVVLALAVLLGGGYVAYSYGLHALQDRLSPPADYSGSGSGRVLVEVRSGDAASDIATTLEAKGVVKSTEAFTDAARNDPRSVGIQVGFYQLQTADVRRVRAGRARATPPTGSATWSRSRRGSASTRSSTSWSSEDRVHAEAVRAGARPTRAASACRRTPAATPEGYLFPATYELTPNATPRSILRRDGRPLRRPRWPTSTSWPRPRPSGYTPHDVMTVASIVQAEGRLGNDFPKIARVHLQPPRAGQAAAARHHDRLHLQDPGEADAPASEQRSVGLAVQHLPQHRAAADADLRAGGGGDQGRARPRRTGRGCTS